jgi:hypothetical protein
MEQSVSPSSRRGSRSSSALTPRRVVVTAAAIALVVAAEVLATLSASAAHRREVTRRGPVRVRVAPVPYGGEPHLPRDASPPLGRWAAAVSFVRDYALLDRRPVIPRTDGTRRVIWLLTQEGRHSQVSATDAEGSIRFVSAGTNRYVVTSALGNFLLGRRGSRGLVVSLPGD